MRKIWRYLIILVVGLLLKLVEVAPALAETTWF